MSTPRPFPQSPTAAASSAGSSACSPRSRRPPPTPPASTPCSRSPRPAGLQTPLHVHYREDEGFYVLEGSVTIQVGDETVELGPGQHAFGPRDIPHRFTVGPDGARMIWVLTPGGFEDFVEDVSVPAEAATVPPPSVLPPENAAEIVLRHGKELLPG